MPMPIEPHEYLGRIPLTEDGPILPPELVARMLDDLTPEEGLELSAYAGDDPETFPIRVSEWLTRRFNLQLRKRQ